MEPPTGAGWTDIGSRFFVLRLRLNIFPPPPMPPPSLPSFSLTAFGWACPFVNKSPLSNGVGGKGGITSFSLDSFSLAIETLLDVECLRDWKNPAAPLDSPGVFAFATDSARTGECPGLVFRASAGGGKSRLSGVAGPLPLGSEAGGLATTSSPPFDIGGTPGASGGSESGSTNRFAAVPPTTAPSLLTTSTAFGAGMSGGSPSASRSMSTAW